MFVDPAYKRKGLGAALLKKAWEQAAGSVGVVCLESTLNATLFYEQFGFHEVGRSTARRNDVDVPVVIMERHGKGAEPGRPKWKSKLKWTALWYATRNIRVRARGRLPSFAIVLGRPDLNRPQVYTRNVPTADTSNSHVLRLALPTDSSTSSVCRAHLSQLNCFERSPARRAISRRNESSVHIR